MSYLLCVKGRASESGRRRGEGKNLKTHQTAHLKSDAFSISGRLFPGTVNMHKKQFKNLYILPVLFDKLYKADYNAKLELPNPYR